MLIFRSTVQLYMFKFISGVNGRGSTHELSVSKTRASVFHVGSRVTVKIHRKLLSGIGKQTKEFLQKVMSRQVPSRASAVIRVVSLLQHALKRDHERQNTSCFMAKAILQHYALSFFQLETVNLFPELHMAHYFRSHIPTVLHQFSKARKKILLSFTFCQVNFDQILESYVNSNKEEEELF